MNEKDFNKMFLGSFTDDRAVDYPETTTEKSMSGIYSHICPKCRVGFFGYKRRVRCFACDTIKRKKRKAT